MVAAEGTRLLGHGRRTVFEKGRASSEDIPVTKSNGYPERGLCRGFSQSATVEPFVGGGKNGSPIGNGASKTRVSLGEHGFFGISP